MTAGRWIGIVAGLILVGLIGMIAAHRLSAGREKHVRTHIGWIAGLVGFGAALPGTAGAAPGTVPPTTFGINASPPIYFIRQRVFANLMLGGAWQSTLKDYKIGPDDVDADGNLKRLPGGAPVARVMTVPNQSSGQATIRCTYQGHAMISVDRVANLTREANGFSFFHINSPGIQHSIRFVVGALDAADPIRNIDCRETTMPSSARFDPAFVKWMSGFTLIRFMDWMNTNNNQPVTWATRHTTHSLDVNKGDGVAIEDMVALVTATGADPWFNMPWNADADYIAHFAKLVHDTLPPERTVYVELSNEVWNGQFAASRQAQEEGIAANYGGDPGRARLYRYAARVAPVMDIWQKAFADRPSKLVRIAATQNSVNSSEAVLGFRDTAKHVDALATAPYFAGDFRSDPPADLEAAYARMDAAVDKAIDKAAANRAVAARYGKRYISYEAGQHIVLRDVALEEKIQRDPRMYEAYKRYLAGWRAQVGDRITLFASVTPISKFGAFGLSEYLSQPLADSPKLRAVREEMAR